VTRNYLKLAHNIAVIHPKIFLKTVIIENLLTKTDWSCFCNNCYKKMGHKL